MIVNVEGLVAGRVATQVAKAAVKGERVIVINAEEAVVVGNPEATMATYKERVNAKVHSNPHFGPKYERIPSKMFRRMVKGMLPNGPRARERCIKRVTVYNKAPATLVPKGEVLNFPELRCNDRHRSVTFKEIATALGGKW